MRSRPHVVITRLNDDELHIYKRILRKAESEFGIAKNQSEGFRIVLNVINEMLKDQAAINFYMHSLDV